MIRFAKSCLSAVSIASMLLSPVIQPAFANSQDGDERGRYEDSIVTVQPLNNAGMDIRHYLHDTDREPHMSREALVKMLQKKIKYVFVIFNENHSFDNEFGTFQVSMASTRTVRSGVLPRTRRALPRPILTLSAAKLSRSSLSG